jgi:RNA polymerase sigma-70 factor, ECF subfamily
MCTPIRKESAVRDNRWDTRPSPVQQSNAESRARKFENEFEVLVEQFRRPLLAFLCRLLDDQRRAEDVAVETFVRLYRRAVRGEADGKFEVTLYRVAIDTAAEPKSAQSERVECPPSPLAGTRSEVQAAVQRCIAGLDEIDRLAVLLHKYQNLSYAQIGSVLSLNETEVKALLFRAYKTVQHRLSARNSG